MFFPGSRYTNAGPGFTHCLTIANLELFQEFHSLEHILEHGKPHSAGLLNAWSLEVPWKQMLYYTSVLDCGGERVQYVGYDRSCYSASFSFVCFHTTGITFASIAPSSGRFLRFMLSRRMYL